MVGYKGVYGRNNYFLFETGFAFARMFSSRVSINELSKRLDTPNAEEFAENDFSWIGSFKLPLNKRKKDNMLLGARTSHSLFSVHKRYKLFNFDYGFEFDFLF